MVVTIVWLVLLFAALGWESYSAVINRRWLSLMWVTAAMSRRPSSRLVLIGVWAFIGVHLFARYTLPDR